MTVDSKRQFLAVELAVELARRLPEPDQIMDEIKPDGR